MNMEQAECSETSADKIQTPGNRPKQRIKILVCFASVLEADRRGIFQNINEFV
jgi:hypothetical protein